MSAYFESGFSVRQPMWHGQGFVAEEYPVDWAEARKWADMEWEPVSRPVMTLRSGIDLVPGTDGLMVTDSKGVARPIEGKDLLPADGHQGIVRDDDDSLLAVMSDEYQIVSHALMGDFIEGVLGVDKAIRFETAGVLKGGRLVWALVYLDEPYQIVADVDHQGNPVMTLPFLAVLNGHDGYNAFKAVGTQVRVVCWNTYQAASMEGDRHGRQFTFTHTGSIVERIQEAKQALAGVREEVKRWQSLSGDLYKVRIEDWQVQTYLEKFLPDPRESGKPITDKTAANIDTARKMFRDIYLDSPTTVAHRETVLGLVDASVEYLDHIRGTMKNGRRYSESYLGRSILGQDDGAKRQVVRWAMEASETPKPVKARATRTRTRKA